MLTEERIKQLALKATRCFRDPTVPTTITEDAIRLAVAETAEACANMAAEYAGRCQIKAIRERSKEKQLRLDDMTYAARDIAKIIRAVAKGAK